MFNDGVLTDKSNFTAHWVDTVTLELVTHGQEQKDGFYIIKIERGGGGELRDITPGRDK